ncbi:nuclear transport factor 2 family protein [Nocardia sp. NPDC004582]
MTDHAEQIRSLLAHLSHLADEGPIDEYFEHYTPDAVWEREGDPQSGVAPQIFRGATEIAASAQSRRDAGIAGPGTSTRHVTSCTAITLLGPDSARAESVWQFFADTTTTPRLISMGRYHDTLTLVDNRWRIAARSISNG